MLLHLAYHLYGPLHGCAGRQLNLADDESLVLIRQEGSGETQEKESHRSHNGAVYNQIAFPFAKGAADYSLIQRSGTFKQFIEPTEEPRKPAFFTEMMPFF